MSDNYNPTEALKLISKGESMLLENGVIRTTKIVAEIGEYYAAKEYGLGFAENTVQKGYDLIDGNGVKYQVKCRRRFNNPYRKSRNTGLIKGLDKDGYDVAIIVEIGEQFELIQIFSISKKVIDKNFGKIAFNIPKLERLADNPI